MHPRPTTPATEAPPDLRGEDGSTLLVAIIAVALLGLLLAAVASLSTSYMSARKRQDVQEAGGTLEDASIAALGDSFRHTPLTTTLNCNNLPSLFNAATVGTGGHLSFATSIGAAPGGGPADRSDFAAAKARCAKPSLPGSGSTAPAYFCVTFPTSPGPAGGNAVASFLRSDQAFAEVKLSFLSLADRKPLSCKQLRQYALGAGAEISYKIYWRNHALTRKEATFNTLSRTIVTDLTPGP